LQERFFIPDIRVFRVQFRHFRVALAGGFIVIQLFGKLSHAFMERGGTRVDQQGALVGGERFTVLSGIVINCGALGVEFQ